MSITATDGINSNGVQVIVIVEDINDNAPVFSNTSCSVPVFVEEVSILILQPPCV